MKCPNCQAEMADDVKFCIKCGTRLQNTEQKNAAPEESGGTVCVKCGKTLHAGAKFCTKCGCPVDGVTDDPVSAFTVPTAPITPVQKTQTPPEPAHDQSAQPYRAPSVSGPSFPSKGVILMVALAIIALIVAILLALKSMGVLSGNSHNADTHSSSSAGSHSGVSSDNEDEEPSDEEDPEAVAARLAEIEIIKSGIEASVAEGDKSEGITEDYPAALTGYITLSNEYGVADEVAQDAQNVFDRYVAQVRFSVSLLDGQKVSSGLYIQSVSYYDDLLGYARGMKAAGYDVDVAAIEAERDSLRDIYREKYIYAINEISSRENWSRDEAWALMNDAASITDENGSSVLFNADDPDDPLRLRYIYSLAWATRKQLETCYADGSISAADALVVIDDVLEETDYNLQLLYDGILYSGLAGTDSSPYLDAYNAIVDKLAENEGITIIPDHSKATATKIDINHFWAFNDISANAAPDYQVSTTNGTTAETRSWIRDNIRVSR